MLEWCMAHPWMVFIIILSALCAINSIGCEIAQAFGRRKGSVRDACKEIDRDPNDAHDA